MPKKIGRPRSDTFLKTRARILQLKRTINPNTGQLNTFAEVAKKLGMTKQGVNYYTKQIPGICHVCCQPITIPRTRKP